MTQRHRPAVSHLLPIVAIAVLTGALFAPVRADDAKPNAKADAAPASYMRIGRPTKTAATLEIAMRRFEKADGNGPTIWLAGVVHIGEPAYYEKLQRFLNAQSLVLYEGVGVPSFADPTPAPDAARAQRTREAIGFVAGMIKSYHKQNGAYPLSLVALRQQVAQTQPRAARWIGMALHDGWDQPLNYKRNADGFSVTSLGADAKPGGVGDAADITQADVDIFDAGALDGPDLQGTMATALDLVFQLDHIDYDRPNFKPCDMTMEQLQKAMGGGGEGNKELKNMMARMDGQSLATGLLRIGAALLQANPQWQSLIKVMMIEMLGSLEGDLSQNAALPANMQKLMEIIVRDRNEIVMQALKTTVKAEDAPNSIAVFYGAGHMDDLERRMINEMGYKPAEDIWLPAFSADAKDAGMSEQEIKMLRQMVQQQMKAMKGR